jgi:TPR repeat protein
MPDSGQDGKRTYATDWKAVALGFAANLAIRVIFVLAVRAVYSGACNGNFQGCATLADFNDSDAGRIADFLVGAGAFLLGGYAATRAAVGGGYASAYYVGVLNAVFIHYVRDRGDALWIEAFQLAMALPLSVLGSYFARRRVKAAAKFAPRESRGVSRFEGYILCFALFACLLFSVSAINFHLMRNAADRGYPIGQIFMGREYKSGGFVRRDYAEAMKWFKKAADQGYPFGDFHIALMYLEGCGVSVDGQIAADRLRKAALSSNPRGARLASFVLGRLYERGAPGLKPDPEEARKWFGKAADGGFSFQHNALDNMFAECR